MSHSSHLGHDQSPVNVSAVMWMFILTTAFLFIVFGGCVLYFQGTIARELANKQITSLPRPLSDLHAYESEQLHKLEWIDRAAGKLQIPIEQAMDRVTEGYSR